MSDGFDFNDVPSPWEQYFYPNTHTLKNIPGIKDDAALEQFEHEVSALRLAEIRLQPITGRFDLKHLQDIHKAVFQDVYEWAGELREVNISKGGTNFARLDHIHASAARLASDLHSENHLKGLAKPEFIDRLVVYYSGWNSLHPFREGNGRATLEFMRQISQNAGYDFDRTKIDQSPGRWYNAAKEGINGNNEPLKRIFSDAVRPILAVDVERLTLKGAALLHPELAPMAAKAHALELQFHAAYRDVPNKAAFLMSKVNAELVRQLDTGKPVVALPQPIRSPVMQSVQVPKM